MIGGILVIVGSYALIYVVYRLCDWADTREVLMCNAKDIIMRYDNLCDEYQYNFVKLHKDIGGLHKFIAALFEQQDYYRRTILKIYTICQEKDITQDELVQRITLLSSPDFIDFIDDTQTRTTVKTSDGVSTYVHKQEDT